MTDQRNYPVHKVHKITVSSNWLHGKPWNSTDMLVALGRAWEKLGYRVPEKTDERFVHGSEILRDISEFSK